MPKVIVVTGGSDGLGKEIAKVLVGKNQVIILAHNEEKLKNVSSEIGSDYVLADVSKYEEVEKAITHVIEKHGRLDALVNCAGIWAQGQITENSPQEIEELLNVNTKGTIFLCKAVIPQMIKQGSGEIINIISQDGLTVKKDRSLYHSSKWAITGFTKCLREDLSDKNIKVTGIYPGLMKTSLFEKKGVERDLSHALELTDVASLVEFVINLKKDTLLPDIGIKHLLNTDTNMDDSGTGMDLNLDPDLITTQGGPQSSNPTAPTTPPAVNPDIIDITPGSAPLPPVQSPQTPTPPLPPSPQVTEPTLPNTSSFPEFPTTPPSPLPPLPPLPVSPAVEETPLTPEPPSVLETPMTPEPPPVTPETPVYPEPPIPPTLPQPALPPFPHTPDAPTPPSSTAAQADEFIPKFTQALTPPENTQPLVTGAPAHQDPPKMDTNFAIDSSSPLFENPEDVKLPK